MRARPDGSAGGLSLADTEGRRSGELTNVAVGAGDRMAEATGESSTCSAGARVRGHAKPITARAADAMATAPIAILEGEVRTGSTCTGLSGTFGSAAGTPPAVGASGASAGCVTGAVGVTATSTAGSSGGVSARVGSD